MGCNPPEMRSNRNKGADGAPILHQSGNSSQGLAHNLNNNLQSGETIVDDKVPLSPQHIPKIDQIPSKNS